MRGRFEDLSGHIFGRLTVLRRVGVRRGYATWLCRCECGTEVEVSSDKLKCGRRTKCGWVNHRARSGKQRAKASWDKMMRRCFDPNDDHWNSYGGRGITVCKRWRRFEGFFEDMGERGVGLTIERLDINGNYEPVNCVWATDAIQRRNRRDTIYVDYGGLRRKLRDLIDELGADYSVVRGRLLIGWSLDRALSERIVRRPRLDGVSGNDVCGTTMRKVALNLTIDPRLRDRFVAAAASEGRSLSNWASRVLELWLDEQAPVRASGAEYVEVKTQS